MESTATNRHKLYEDFLREFPLESLNMMPLEKYANLAPAESFCYWLESKTYSLGSIWGGTSSKFGIYKYVKKPNQPNLIVSDDEYAWYKKYGTSNRQEAYRITLESVVKVAKLASESKFDEIDNVDALGPVVRWKIAFLYSDKQLIPIYERSMLVKIATILGMQSAPKATNWEIQKYLIECKGENDLFDYYDYLLSLNLDDQESKDKPNKLHIWLYAPGVDACIWEDCLNDGQMYLGWDQMGDLTKYKSREEMTTKLKEIYGADKSYKNDSLAVWEFANVVSIGDVVYAKRGRHSIIGRGVVKGEYIFDSTKEAYIHTRRVDWEIKGNWETKDMLPMKTLTDMSKYPDIVKTLNNLVASQADVDSDENDNTHELPNAPYSKDDFLNEVFVSEQDYNNLLATLKLKKNIILQGAPGVGKTFSAKRLAYSIMGEKDDSRVGFVQFHQNYSYEDFVMGYKPNSEGGFELKNGIFYNFCQKAATDPHRDYFFIIDEINRGNLSKIFGELLMLIEKDYRSDKITLAYSDEYFAVPNNLYIIGMMNTADRSLAMIDYALRRRFSFFSMKPGFKSEGFKKYQEQLNHELFNDLITTICKLNEAIVMDESLGSGFEIGHSYFCGCNQVSKEWLKAIVNYEIIPMLEEYWFDNKQKVDDWSKDLRHSIND